MKEYTKNIIIIIIVLILDILWITTNIDMYSKSIEKIQKSEINIRYHYAFIAYLFVIGTTIYITIPYALSRINNYDSNINNLYYSFIYGGIIGFCIYGIYNFTCLSIYQDYDIKVAMIDTLWGTILNTIVVFIYINL